MRWKILLAVLLLTAIAAAHAVQKNGFDLTGSLLSSDEMPPVDLH